MDRINGNSPTRPGQTQSTRQPMHVPDSPMTTTQDIPDIPEVTLDSLMHAVLPHVPVDKLNKVCDKLVESGRIKGAYSNDPAWSCLLQSSRTCEQPETLVFQSLETIAMDIANHSNIPKPTLRLKVAGYITPLTDRDDTSRPDGFFHLGNAELEDVDWADIIMPIEFKNEPNDPNQTDDIAKVLWSMHNIMRNDPRRRYVHGLTWENTEARLWFHDRSDVVASVKFDINKDWRSLVRIIMSILLANPVELGYDPTVKAVTSNDGNSEPSYDITIHNAKEGSEIVYRTVRILSDVGVDSMACSGSRVWEVQKLVDGIPLGPSYALKDVWALEDRIPEHVILQEIRKKQPGYSDYFLTPLDYGFVPRHPDDPHIADSTHRTLGHPRDLELTGNVLSTRIAQPSRQEPRKAGGRSQSNRSGWRDSVGGPDDMPILHRAEGHRSVHLSSHARQHYRILFKEIGKPVHDLRKSSDVFLAIQGGWEGLHAMHLCGYMHRDVSSGNILLVDPHGNKRGVIMDLEYVKAIDDTSASDDVKVGTAAFMATEVGLMQHHRLRTLRAGRVPTNWVVPPVPADLPLFRHNPLHDMESVWWLCVWMMFHLGFSEEKAQSLNYQLIFGSQQAKRDFSESVTFGPFARYLSVNPALSSTIEIWSKWLICFYSYSYRQQDSLTNPPAILRVGDDVVERSYQHGREALVNLKDASKWLPEYPTLRERSPDYTPTTTSRKVRRRIIDCVLMPASKKRRTEE